MPPERCCPHYHRAVELIGRRWTGAIVAVLLDADAPLRFTEIAQAVPDLSDRLLAERVKELERAGIVAKDDGVYALTAMGRALEPAIRALQAWGRRWLAHV
jgi:DNA-binding HxlR family transcriptional regulator